MDTGRETDLLLGMFAVQVKGVAPRQLAEVMEFCETAPTVPFARHLINRGLLDEQDLRQLERLVQESVSAHGGDAARALALFGGAAQVRTQFFSGGVASYLDQVDTAPLEAGEAFHGTEGGISGVSETPGRYTLISHHARGGMGRVLIVHDEHLGRNIALKELMPAGSAGSGSDRPSPMRQSAALISRFLQEARITSQLEHPAIVPVYEVGRRHDGTPYYTMRLVRGKTFSAALRGCETIDDRLRLLSNFVSLCQAIAYAHSRAIIHRDIKPANVMLGQFGETVVLDWGLAKMRGGEDIHKDDIRDALHSLEDGADYSMSMTASGRALGTPHYMPPEQAAGDVEAIDERSDVYSLGAVLYEILTGTTPHSGKSTREIIDKVLSEPCVPVLEAAPDAPPELAVICEKALSRARDDRYQTAAELAEEVERFIQGSLVRAYRYSLAEILAHYYSKHRPLVNTAAACAVLLAAVGVFAYASILHARNREHDQRLIAETAQHNENAARIAAERKNYQSQIHLAQAYLKGREPGRANEVLWETAKDQRGWEWSCLLNRANPEMYNVKVPDSSVYAVVFSPDGARMGTNTYPGAPAIYDTATGKKLVDLEDEEPLNYFQTLFSPDGTLCAGVGAAGIVHVWDTATGKRLHRLEQPSIAYEAAFDASGKTLFVGCGDRKVRAYDLAAETLAYALDVDEFPVVSVSLSPDGARLLAGGAPGGAQLWDLATSTRLFSFSGVSRGFSPDGRRVVTAQDADGIVWDAETGVEIFRLRGNRDRITHVSFSEDGTQLLSASLDGSARVWNAASGVLTQEYATDDGAPLGEAYFLEGGNAVVAHSTDNACLLFCGSAKSPVYRFQCKGRTGLRAAMQPRGTLLAVTSGERFFQVVNPLAPTGVSTVVVARHSGMGVNRRLSAAASGSMLAVSDPSVQGVLVMEPGTGQSRGLFATVFRKIPSDVALSDDGKRLAFVAEDYTPLAVGGLPGAPKPVPFTRHTAEVRALALSPDGALVASGDATGMVFLWDANTTEVKRTLDGRDNPVTCLNFSPDGRRLIIARQDGSLGLYASGTGGLTRSFPKQSRPVASASLDGAGARMVSVNSDGAMQLWDVASGRLAAGTKINAQVCEENYILQGHFAETRFWPGDRLFMERFPFDGKRIWDASAWVPLVVVDSEEEVCPVNGGRSVAVLDTEGNIRIEDIPEAASLSPQTYEAYKKEWGTRRALAFETETPPLHVLVSREDLEQALRDAARGGSPAMQDGRVVLEFQGTGLTQAMMMAGLLDGDALCGINGVEFPDADEARKALERASQNLSGQEQDSLNISVIRGGKAMAVTFWTSSLAREALTCSTTREKAVAMLQGNLESLPGARMAKSHNPAWIDFVPAEEDRHSCILTVNGPLTLTGLNGERFKSLDDIEQRLNSLSGSFASGEVSEFAMTLRQGTFKELTCTIRAEEH